MMGEMKIQDTLTFGQFSAENLKRCESPDGFNHPLQDWSLADWMVATTGELGEAANVLKKLHRVRDGVPGNKESHAELLSMFANELADIFIYLDLMIQRAGHDTAYLATSKFDKTSDKIGYPRKFWIPE